MATDPPDDGAIREGEPPYSSGDRRIDKFENERKRAAFYRFAARILVLVGLVMFGFGIFPCVNPIQFRLTFGPEYLGDSIISLVASILILWLAWRLSRYAHSLKQQDGTKG